MYVITYYHETALPSPVCACVVNWQCLVSVCLTHQQFLAVICGFSNGKSEVPSVLMVLSWVWGWELGWSSYTFLFWYESFLWSLCASDSLATLSLWYCKGIGLLIDWLSYHSDVISLSWAWFRRITRIALYYVRLFVTKTDININGKTETERIKTGFKKHTIVMLVMLESWADRRFRQSENFDL